MKNCLISLMDPITQGTIGGTYSQSFATKGELKIALICGVLAGMAPDLDILIQSPSDPMIYFEYHRHFTHSLFFIPFGAFIVAFLIHKFIFKETKFKRIFLYSALGYGTHALLDACTSYGTLLLWPLSRYRFAWNNVSIIDPLYTIPLIVLILVGQRTKRRKFTVLGIFYSFFYLGLGLYMNQKAQNFGHELAKSRGHIPVRLEARPSFANIYLWRVLYEFDNEYYVDAIRSDGKIIEGEKVKKFNLEIDMPNISKSSQHFRDIEKFRWFSKDYLILDPDDPSIISDVRYSFLANEIRPLWGVKVKEDTSEHVKHVVTRKRPEKAISKHFDMLFK